MGKPGDLDFMVTWQSLDGRICVEYKSTRKEAVEHFLWLQGLGRTPKLWKEVKIK
jgi:hypothetical protein